MVVDIYYYNCVCSNIYIKDIMLLDRLLICFRYAIRKRCMRVCHYEYSHNVDDLARDLSNKIEKAISVGVYR